MRVRGFGCRLEVHLSVFFCVRGAVGRQLQTNLEPSIWWASSLNRIRSVDSSPHDLYRGVTNPGRISTRDECDYSTASASQVGGELPRPSTLNPHSSTLYPQHSTLNPQPPTLNPQPSTPNPQPSTRNPQTQVAGLPPSPPRGGGEDTKP